MSELLLTFGHSIVRAKAGTWFPSSTYQAVTWKEAQAGRIPERTFIHEPGLDPDSERAYLGGGMLVVEALFRLWRMRPHAKLAIIGGKPAAMEERFGHDVPDEAAVMADRFRYLAARSFLHPPAIEVIGNIRVTEDDMRALLALAKSHRPVTAICMQFRELRARALLIDYARKHKLASVARRVTFSDAEQFFPEYLDDFVRMNGSAAYRHTMRSEAFGVRKLLSGTSGDYIRAR